MDKPRTTTHGRWLVTLPAFLAAVGGTIVAVRMASPPVHSAIQPELVRGHVEGRDPDTDPCAAGVVGAIYCEGLCVDATEDAQHCGGCGIACTGDLTCVTGRCVRPSDPQAEERVRSADLNRYAGSSGSYAYTFVGARYGGRIDGIVANDSDQTDLLIAAPGGGLWRTQNNGSSWSQTANYGLGDFTSWKLQRDRISSSRLFLITPMTVYSSTDTAATWSNIGGRSMPSLLLPWGTSEHVSDPAPFAQMVFDSSTRLLLWGPTCEGLMYSTNGTSFTQLWPFTGGSGELNNCVNAISVDDGTKRVFISVMSANSPSPVPKIFRSNCAWTSAGPCCTTPGSCWDQVTTGLGSGLTTAEMVYTGVSTWHATSVPTSGASTLYNGSGNPTNWTAASTAYPPDGGGVSHSPRPVEYLGGNHILVGNVLPYSTTDLGSSWSSLFIPGMHGDTRSFYFSPSLSRLWATTDGGNFGGAYNIVRWDATVGTHPSNGTAIPVTGESGLPLWQPYFTAIVPLSSGGPRLLMGLQDDGGGCSSDNGSTWSSTFSGGGDTWAFAQAPSNVEVGYTIGLNGLYKYTDMASASSCSTLTRLGPSSVSTSGIWSRDLIAVNATNADRVYVASDARVTRVTFPNTGTPTITYGAYIMSGADYCTITTLTATSSGDLYAGTRNCGTYVSSDEGTTWTSWGPSWSPPPVSVQRISLTTYGGGTSWIASTSGLYRKVGSGAWSLVHGGSGYTVNDIAVDPTCPRRLYVALGFVGSIAYHRGGINTTEDNGASWTNTTAGLAIHQAPVSDIELQPGNNRYLYASVFGQGLWRMDRGANPSCP